MIEQYTLRDNFKIIQPYRSVLVVGEEKQRDDICISYVIPTRNRIETLRSAVQSVIHINHQASYEIIVVDNSEDLSENSEVKAYFQELNDPAIKYYVNEKNLGMEGNWNRGAELAQGKYVCYLHDDDLLHENYEIEILNCLRNALGNQPEIGFLKPEFRMFYDESEKPVLDQAQERNVRRLRKINSLAMGQGPTATPTCGLLFSRNALMQVGGFDEQLHPSADHIMGFIILQKGYTGYYCTTPLGYYRIGINESMRFETIVGFCKKDQIIRDYMYRDNLLFWLFGMLFRKVQYAISIDDTQQYIQNWLHCSYEHKKLDYLNAYRPYALGKRLIKVFRRCCVALSRFL